MESTSTARRLALLGAILFTLGLLTGWISGTLVNPRMGLSSHLEGLMNGILLLALAGCWGHVRLSPGQERWCVRLLVFGTFANWFTTLLAAWWGAGENSMPIASAGHRAAWWQEGLVMALLIALSLAMMAGIGLVIKGLIAGRGQGQA